MKSITPSFTATGIPKTYYNLFADAQLELDPPQDPQTGAPVHPSQLTHVFGEGLMEQEASSQVHIPIPAPVLEAYARYRPTPLLRAERFEKAIGTNCPIYYKYEGVSPVGSHKLNTALPQAYYNAREGTKRLATETGAGQWGTAVSFAAQLFGLEAMVYMVRVSHDQKAFRRTMMELYGAKVAASPSPLTACGRRFLERDPNHPGSLGIAISEAVEDSQTHAQTKYTLGSVFGHVLLHQTIIGQEAIRQLEASGIDPDIVVACHGGGSNFGGLTFPFVRARLDGQKIRIVAAEPQACPTLTRGEFRYDYGETGRLMPLVKMYTLGADFIPDPIHAGGLRYHGASPHVSRLLADRHIEATACGQTETFSAARLFAGCEGIVPAPESAHAIAACIQLARAADAEKKPQTILFGLSGHGLLDLGAYSAVEAAGN